MLGHSTRRATLEARRPLAMSHAIRASSPRRVSSIKVVVFQGLGVARKGVGAAVAMKRERLESACLKRADGVEVLA